MDRISVKDFVDLFEAKDSFDVSKYISNEYIPYEQKGTMIIKLIELCGRDIEDKGKLYYNRVSMNLFNILTKIDMFTNVKINWENAIEEYDMLQEHDLIRLLLDKVNRKELKEYDTIFELASKDFYDNNYSAVNYFDRYMDSFVKGIAPFLDKVWEDMKAMDLGGLMSTLKEIESDDNNSDDVK